MPTFNNGEGLDSVRTKINAAIEKVDGTSPITSADINGGTIDGTVIGGTTPAAVTATSLTATGTVTADAYDLDAIAASKAVTAVDVFVYDTSKDSDGGAWRKRTQHTSWYNETLNTATRGSRKEFPAVAVIVAGTDKSVTIYDGDDPDLPMWMVFNSADARMLGNTTTAVVLKNGALWVALNGYGVSEISFIKDEAWRHRNNVNSGFYGKFKGFIADRNVAASFSGSDYIGALVNDLCNDVAMTVLPNAPIDAATGLPVPTIAVATAGGVSVIKDDETVVDPITSEGYAEVSFDTDGTLYSLHGRSTNSVVVVHKTYISDGQSADHLYYETSTTGNNYLKFVGTQGVHIANGDNFYVGSLSTDAGGLSHIAEDKSYSTQDVGMVAYTASDYATGWMNGDIKLATLSDTDATNVTGSELVTNGTFDTDTSGWSGLNGATLSVVSGALRVTNDGATTYPGAQQSITTEVGKTYTVSARGLSSPAWEWYIEVVGGGGTVQQLTEYQAYTFTALSTSTTIRVIFRKGNGFYKDFDNVSVRLAEEDRSVNGNGLQVFGTVTRTPVATGADLVAYSGFSGSNYLEQPYNSDLDFGTGDFCVMGWFKTSVANVDYLFHRATAGLSADTGFFGYVFTDGKVYFATRSGSTSYAVSSNSAVNTDTWHHYCALRNNGVLYLYVDGVLNGTASDTGQDVTGGGDEGLFIGVRADLGQIYDGSLALWRISATAPTAEQIKKIYEDEKVLFQENAAATLYGASDAVTALAHDSDTGLLHVGTSAGRSVFQGLRRVSNTTTAVGTAISASNGLVVEE